MIRQVLTACAMMLFVIQSHGQGHSTEISAPYGSEFTINGLIIDSRVEYSEADLITALGRPDYVAYDPIDRNYTYVYNRNMTEKPDGYVPITDHDAEITLPCIPGPIISAYVYGGTFVANGHIRVGDPISKVYDLGGKFKTHDYGNGKGVVLWCPPGKNYDWIVCPEFTYNEKDIITSFGLWIY